MNEVNDQLFEYIKEKTREGVTPAYLKRVLLENDWAEAEIDSAFAVLREHQLGAGGNTTISEHIVAEEPQAMDNSFASTHLTMDKIIEKIIPIAGALFLIVGFGYLIYANAWVHLDMEIRLILGFFFSVAIIGGSFSLAEKMRYFTDIGIGSGVLLLYGTLVYGSRATELAAAAIPEVATLITAAIFTIAVSYFASKRNSKVILILGMVGAYITPFVIGQHEVWVENVSFNAYLIYFFAVSISVFLIGREISVRDIIPLNMIGLFLGVSTLWNLAETTSGKEGALENFFTGEHFTAILFLVLVLFTTWSILLSATKFRENDDGYLSLGYIAPIIWFAFNISNLSALSEATVGALYAVIAVSCFIGWHILKGEQTKYQHGALYAAGLVSAFLSFFSLFQEFDVYTSMAIAYSSLIFGALYIIGEGKLERFVSYIVVSMTGSVLSLYHILEANLQFETLFIVVALLPAMAAAFIAKKGPNRNIDAFAVAYSVLSGIVAVMFILADILDYIDVTFVVFYLLPLSVLVYLAYIQITAPDSLILSAKSAFLRVPLIWFALGFIGVFIDLVVSVYPAPTDIYLFTHTNLPTDWTMIHGIFATAILFVGLFISRRLQLEQVVKRPSFILVIFGFATLLLTGNYIISAIANDLNIAHTDGGPRAIATTLWWAAIAIYMLFKGIRHKRLFHAEKLLGLMLLGITVIKVILYDIATMGMQNKIIVLMMVGGAMLLFSYFVRSKDLLKETETSEE